MKNSSFNKLILATFTGLCVFSAQAGSIQKLGFVNAARVYSESETAKRIETGLQKEFGKQQQQLVQLQEKGIRIQQKLNSGKLKGTELTKMEQQLNEIGRQYRIESAELAEDYNLRRNEEFAGLQRNANNIILSIAKSEGYDLIVQEAVFVNGDYDITDRVIKMLDSGN